VLRFGALGCGRHSGILSPQRLPFRHPGIGSTNLTKTRTYCNTAPAGTCVESRELLALVPGEVLFFVGVRKRACLNGGCQLLELLRAGGAKLDGKYVIFHGRLKLGDENVSPFTVVFKIDTE
jgi:hypothetical protein